MRARRRRRAAAWRGSVIEMPVMRTSPADGGSSPTTIRATVDLPEPDSPTMAKGAPRSIAKPTRSTAVRNRRGSRSITRLSQGFDTSKTRRRSVTST